MKPRAFITGCTGQDGSYLAELLIEKGYQVYGLVRRSSTNNTRRISHILDDLKILHGDVTDYSSVYRAMKLAEPSEIYHLAAQSFVGGSFEYPAATLDITGKGTLNVLEAMRILAPYARMYQASSSEQFGNSYPDFDPISPYGCAKVFAHYLCSTYRLAYHLHINCGIAFNHESPRRGLEFVTQKIVQTLVRIKLGSQEKLKLGNVGVVRDWSHAGDIMQAAHLMLQQEQPDDYILASGISHSVSEFAEQVASYLKVDLPSVLEISSEFKRPTDVWHLRGNYTKALRTLGWSPTVTFEELIHEMVDHALANAESHNPVQIH